jgi:hypothetical protein
VHQRCPPASRGHGIPGGQLCYASASGDSLGPRRLSLAILARGDRNRTTSGKEEVTRDGATLYSNGTSPLLLRGPCVPGLYPVEDRS